MANFSPQETTHYTFYFKTADKDGDGRIGLEDAKFLQKSKISKQHLAQIWGTITQNTTNSLSKQQFFQACRLIALAQNGKPINASSLRSQQNFPLARFQGVQPPAASFDWRISNTVKGQVKSHFSSLDPQRKGVISGASASQFFLKSGLSKQDLGLIWNLADQSKNGLLTLYEFTIAMALISARLKGESIPSSIPRPLLESISDIKKASGGVRASSSSSSSSTSKGKKGKESSSSSSSSPWYVSAQKRKEYAGFFAAAKKDMQGFLPGQEAAALFSRSGIDKSTLAKIWNLSDINKDGKLDEKEFCVAMHCINMVRRKISLPSQLPSSLVQSLEIKEMNRSELDAVFGGEDSSKGKKKESNKPNYNVDLINFESTIEVGMKKGAGSSQNPAMTQSPAPSFTNIPAGMGQTSIYFTNPSSAYGRPQQHSGGALNYGGSQMSATSSQQNLLGATSSQPPNLMGGTGQSSSNNIVQPSNYGGNSTSSLPSSGFSGQYGGNMQQQYGSNVQQQYTAPQPDPQHEAKERALKEQEEKLQREREAFERQKQELEQAAQQLASQSQQIQTEKQQLASQHQQLVSQQQQLASQHQQLVVQQEKERETIQRETETRMKENEKKLREQHKMWEENLNAQIKAREEQYKILAMQLEQAKLMHQKQKQEEIEKMKQVQQDEIDHFKAALEKQKAQELNRMKNQLEEEQKLEQQRLQQTLESQSRQMQLQLQLKQQEAEEKFQSQLQELQKRQEMQKQHLQNMTLEQIKEDAREQLERKKAKLAEWRQIAEKNQSLTSFAREKLMQVENMRARVNEMRIQVEKVKLNKGGVKDKIAFNQQLLQSVRDQKEQIVKILSQKQDHIKAEQELLSSFQAQLRDNKSALKMQKNDIARLKQEIERAGSSSPSTKKSGWMRRESVRPFGDGMEGEGNQFEQPENTEDPVLDDFGNGRQEGDPKYWSQQKDFGSNANSSFDFGSSGGFEDGKNNGRSRESSTDFPSPDDDFLPPVDETPDPTFDFATPSQPPQNQHPTQSQPPAPRVNDFMGEGVSSGSFSEDPASKSVSFSEDESKEKKDSSVFQPFSPATSQSLSGASDSKKGKKGKKKKPSKREKKKDKKLKKEKTKSKKKFRGKKKKQPPISFEPTVESSQAAPTSPVSVGVQMDPRKEKDQAQGGGMAPPPKLQLPPDAAEVMKNKDDGMFPAVEDDFFRPIDNDGGEGGDFFFNQPLYEGEGEGDGSQFFGGSGDVEGGNPDPNQDFFEGSLF